MDQAQADKFIAGRTTETVLRDPATAENAVAVIEALVRRYDRKAAKRAAQAEA